MSALRYRVEVRAPGSRPQRVALVALVDIALVIATGYRTALQAGLSGAALAFALNGHGPSVVVVDTKTGEDL